MVSICAQNNSNYDSNDLASSDVFVKLSQHTSVEMSDFTVFVLVFLSYYLHLQSLKYHVSEMILGSQSIVEDSLAAYSTNNVATKLQQSKTISLVNIYTFLTKEEKLSKTKLFGLFSLPTFKIVIPFMIAVVIFIVFLRITAPVWPSQLVGENITIIGMLTAVASLGLSYFLLTVETPALLWIILVSIGFAVYAVVKTSTCDANKVCLDKPEGYGDNFLDFNYLWISLAVAMFVIQKILFSILLFRHGPLRIRGFSFMCFLLFYVFMIVTTFQSSPETKHHQDTPCTSKGSFVGQLIYWPLFLIIVFYIERGSYTFRDEISVRAFGTAILTYIVSTLFFLVPTLTIFALEGSRDTAISRMTCSLRRPTIKLDTPDSRCCKTQKLLSLSLKIFDVYYNDLHNEQSVVGSNISMTFELIKIVNGIEKSIPANQITYEATPNREYALQIIRGSDKSNVTISNGETLGQFQIAMKAGTLAFDESDQGVAQYTLRITFQDQSRLSFYQIFSSITHNQSFTFLQTEELLESENVVGCTGRNAPKDINVRGNLKINEFNPGSGMNPITFTGRHFNTGPGMGALWGLFIGAALASTYLGLTNATKLDPTSASRKPVSGLLTGIFAGLLYGGFVGVPSGAISGKIVENILAKNTQKKTWFEYLDANNEPVARVKADDAAAEADSTLEKIPLNDTHTDRIWQYCKTRDQTATSSVSNSSSCTPIELASAITYTPPGHCKYIADFNIDFSKYPDTSEETGVAHQLEFNTNTAGNDKVYIHYHQYKANDPIFGPDGYIYWLLFFAFLILITFVIQAFLLYIDRETFLSKRLQGATNTLSSATSSIAIRAGTLRNSVRGGLPQASTRDINSQTSRMTTRIRRRRGYDTFRRGVSELEKVGGGMIKLAGAVKNQTGDGLSYVGDSLRDGGTRLYDATVRRAVKLRDSSYLTSRGNGGSSRVINGNVQT
uniref:Uncharacterized protein n=1 Tax=viral metagenome TaxID=1070528 RepID=A0A6C0J0J5_9ZZZZ